MEIKIKLNKTKAVIILFVLLLIGAIFLIPKKQDNNANLWVIPSTMEDLCKQMYSSFNNSDLADYAQFDYDGLYYCAETIALATAADDLTAENSKGIAESGDRYHYAHSVRNVDVLHYYKNEQEYGSSLDIVEECVMNERGTVIAKVYYYPLLKGSTYLLFLGFSSYYGYPVSLSADNGTFNLTYLRLNSRTQVITEALYSLDLLKFKPKYKEAVEAFIASQLVMGTGYALEEYDKYYDSKNWGKITLSTEYTYDDMAIELGYKQLDNGYLFRVGNLIYGTGEFEPYNSTTEN